MLARHGPESPCVHPLAACPVARPLAGVHLVTRPPQGRLGVVVHGCAAAWALYWVGMGPGGVLGRLDLAGPWEPSEAGT